SNTGFPKLGAVGFLPGLKAMDEHFGGR
ncbi:MAG: hypothetical protein RIS79_2808, partial [Verrucomicrobiota bacterium]